MSTSPNAARNTSEAPQYAERSNGLVLTRRPGESFYIVPRQVGAQAVQVTVAQIYGDKVRVATDADRQIYTILRPELCAREGERLGEVLGLLTEGKPLTPEAVKILDEFEARRKPKCPQLSRKK